MRDLPREKFRVIFPNITCCECYRNFRIFVLPFWVRNLYPSILSVRSNTFACNIRKLQGERNFAARIVSGTRRFDHVTLAMKNLRWIPDKSHSYLRDAILAFKSMTAQLKKKYLCPNFISRGNIGSRATQLNIPLFKTKSRQRYFHYRTVAL